MFGNLGFTEILLIAIVALVIFGPHKLPELGRSLGKTMREFKNGARELMEDVRTPPEAERKDVTPSAAPSETVQHATAATKEQAAPAAASPTDIQQDKPVKPAADPRRLPE